MVARQIGKWGGACILSAFFLGKTVTPYLNQVRVVKSEEFISDESIVRRFEQCLLEGQARFNEDFQSVLELIDSFFNVESLIDRLRTCKTEDKPELWETMKILVTARLITTIYLNNFVFLLSHAEMVLIGRLFSKSASQLDEHVLSRCQKFLNEMKGFYSFLVADLSPIILEGCKGTLNRFNLDSKAEGEEFGKYLLNELKRNVDPLQLLERSIVKFKSIQLARSSEFSELIDYTRCRVFLDLEDFLICDSLNEVATDGSQFIESRGKTPILLTWITYFSSLTSNRIDHPIEQFLTKKWVGQKRLFSHLAVLFCE